MEKENKKITKKVTTNSKNTTKKATVKKVPKKDLETKKVVPEKVEKKEEVKVTPIKVDKAKVKAAKKKNKVYYANNEAGEFINFLIIVVIISILCAGIYFGIRAFITKDLFNSSDTTEEVTEGEINYDVATMGMILNRPYSEYYVVIYNTSEGDYVSDMSSLVYNYTQKDEHLHMYTVDLSNKLNSEYYDPENVNVNAKSLSDIKVGDITLIKVKNGAITKYIVDLSKMQTELGI